MAIRKVCCRPGCDDIAVAGGAHCPYHEDERKAKLSARRARAKLSSEAQAGALLYATKEWKTGRRVYLARNPLCVDCGELGLVVEATEVDHVKPHRGDRAKFFDRSNWQALCKPCHSRKTAREVLALGGGRKI
ncbi:HNH endonuclease [Thalassovita gelatinovora]|uniref:Putative HNH nuclease YajD n=1 Tax=Thalassovita gelatinovora TaxID=53501 RepID=A0A0P1FKP1_THAGE|nr:HNH endonuclease signature motif containing protein [Thalassovita gelatinovora]QIZ79064.1 HNH endonuclease [Thalassovita gelatinovora]CUH68670.1 HNH endonuclease [Thalassovita gelatinovora]SEQ56460.1 5-methylcytosine-specific restriction enzyme A [Thalassovita gelatinovora]